MNMHENERPIQNVKNSVINLYDRYFFNFLNDV